MWHMHQCMGHSGGGGSRRNRTGTIKPFGTRTSLHEATELRRVGAKLKISMCVLVTCGYSLWSEELCREKDQYADWLWSSVMLLEEKRSAACDWLLHTVLLLLLLFWILVCFISFWLHVCRHQAATWRNGCRSSSATNPWSRTTCGSTTQPMWGTWTPWGTCCRRASLNGGRGQGATPRGAGSPNGSMEKSVEESQ